MKNWREKKEELKISDSLAFKAHFTIRYGVLNLNIQASMNTNRIDAETHEFWGGFLRKFGENKNWMLFGSIELDGNKSKIMAWIEIKLSI